MARNQGWHGAPGAVRVAVLHPTRRTVLTYGNDIGRHPDDDRLIAVNCDDGSARYVHRVNVRHLEPGTAP